MVTTPLNEHSAGKRQHTATPLISASRAQRTPPPATAPETAERLKAMTERLKAMTDAGALELACCGSNAWVFLSYELRAQPADVGRQKRGVDCIGEDLLTAALSVPAAGHGACLAHFRTFCEALVAAMTLHRYDLEMQCKAAALLVRFDNTFAVMSTLEGAGVAEALLHAMDAHAGVVALQRDCVVILRRLFAHIARSKGGHDEEVELTTFEHDDRVAGFASANSRVDGIHLQLAVRPARLPPLHTTGPTARSAGVARQIRRTRAHHDIDMDYVIAKRLEHLKRNWEMQGAVWSTTATPATQKVELGVIFAVCTGLLATYLSFSSNKVLDTALARVSPQGQAGTFVNVFKALSAMGSGGLYLLYFMLFKHARVAAIKKTM
ncbi:hypothetical protein JKP88DRAFT_241178 [Tribonema minus]|uniref:Uncharacterized protein n=1 Tax=Tribonema minus TaxID=303371 RepID=A0A835YWQ5_9STRA|nr:hypothetical protein JKP88DRAFT_241178 [Tribonema minus]